MPTITSEVRARLAGIVAGEDHGGRAVAVGRLRARQYRIALDEDGYPPADAHRTYELRFVSAQPLVPRNRRAGRCMDVQRWDLLVAYVAGLDEPSLTPEVGPADQSPTRAVEEDAASDFAVVREALEDPSNWGGEGETTPRMVSVETGGIELRRESDGLLLARVPIEVQVSYDPGQTWDAIDTFDLSGTVVAVGATPVSGAALAIVSGSGSDTSDSAGAWTIGVAASGSVRLVRATKASYVDAQAAFLVQSGPVALGRIMAATTATMSSMYADLALAQDAADGTVAVLFEMLDGAAVPSGCAASLSLAHDGAFKVESGVASFSATAGTDGSHLFANVAAGDCTVTPSLPSGYVCGAAGRTHTTTVTAGKLTVHRYVVRPAED